MGYCTRKAMEAMVRMVERLCCLISNGFQLPLEISLQGLKRQIEGCERYLYVGIDGGGEEPFQQLDIFSNCLSLHINHAKSAFVGFRLSLVEEANCSRALGMLIGTLPCATWACP